MRGSASKGVAAVLFVVACAFALLANYWVGSSLMGNMADRDFMSLWAGGKAILLGLDPYDHRVWPELRAQYGSTWNPEPICLYPLWTLLVCIPIALMPFHVAVSVWMTASELALPTSILLLLLTMRHQRARWMVLSALVGGLTFRPFIASLTSGQIAPFLLLTLAGAITLYAQKQSLWSGVLLALLMLKPNPFVLFLPAAALLFLVRKDWHALGGLAMGIVVLLVASWLVSPRWLIYWLDVRFKGEVTFRTPTLWGLAFDLAGPEYWQLVGGLMIVLVSVTVLGVVVWRREDWPFGLSLALCGSLLVTPYLWNYDQLALLVPALVAFCHIQSAFRRWVGVLIWCLVLLVVPWGLFVVANWRGFDSLSVLVTLSVAAYLCWAYWSGRNRRNGL